MTKHTLVITRMFAGIEAGTITSPFSTQDAITLNPDVNPVTVQTVLSDESNPKYAKYTPGIVSLTRSGRGMYAPAKPVAAKPADPLATLRAAIQAKRADADQRANVVRVIALCESLTDTETRDVLLAHLHNSPFDWSKVETIAREVAA